MTKCLFASEFVTEEHLDKACDQISDAVLDDILARDPTARVACETLTTTGIVIVMSKVATKHYADIPSIARYTVGRIGCTGPAYGFDYRSCTMMAAIDEQSPDITMGVNQSYEHQEGGTDTADLIGAGDQGMIFGYAYGETDMLMPAPIDLTHRLARQLTDVRKSGRLSWLRPGGKNRVIVEYSDDGKVLSCPTIVVSTQHDPDITLKNLRKAVMEEITRPIIPAHYITKGTRLYVNPTGRFMVGGPVGGTGLTGHKIIANAYGSPVAYGGGCFSGKGPTKVDRSAAHMARYIAKNLVAAGLCHKYQIKLTYAIGVTHPISVLMDTYDTGVLDEEKFSAIVNERFGMRSVKIVEHLNLRHPIYEQTAAYGHFGRINVDLPWGYIDVVEKLKSYL